MQLFILSSFMILCITLWFLIKKGHIKIIVNFDFLFKVVLLFFVALFFGILFLMIKLGNTPWQLFILPSFMILFITLWFLIEKGYIKIKVDPFDLFKVVLLFFIALFFGILFLMIKLGNAPWYAWFFVPFSLFILVILYDGYFLHILPVAGRNLEREQKNMDIIVYSEKGFTIKNPISNQTNFIAWASIEAIIYRDQCYGEDYNFQYLFYLITPSIYSLDKNAVWIYRLLFYFNPNSKRLWISDNHNKDFFTLKDRINEYLVTTEHIDYDSKRGKVLVQKDTKISGTKIIHTERWEPVKGIKSVQLVYDSKKQTLSEVYKRYGHF